MKLHADPRRGHGGPRRIISRYLFYYGGAEVSSPVFVPVSGLFIFGPELCIAPERDIMERDSNTPQQSMLRQKNLCFLMFPMWFKKGPPFLLSTSYVLKVLGGKKIASDQSPRQLAGERDHSLPFLLRIKYVWFGAYIRPLTETAIQQPKKLRRRRQFAKYGSINNYHKRAIAYCRFPRNFSMVKLRTGQVPGKPK